MEILSTRKSNNYDSAKPLPLFFMNVYLTYSLYKSLFILHAITLKCNVVADLFPFITSKQLRFFF